jgi:hypothetical protein
MATLILSGIGSALGGRTGSAIGAYVGLQIDSRLFAPKARQGPRLGDLAVQTSSYGSEIPKIFGRMRVAGTVIWATDLKEEKSKSGGKGRPKTVNYSYSASFAVALSGRPLRAVRRIWADGKLLRGAEGDFKTATGFRFHGGSEDQAADPLIAAVEGSGQAPAYRGIAYAVFEDFQLADYGNRIPSLTFEVEAEAAPVAIGEIAGELSASEIVGGATPSLYGYAALGDSVRAAVQDLAEIIPLSLTQEEDSLRLSLFDATAALMVAAEEGGAGPRQKRAQDAFNRSAAPVTEVTVAYYEPDRDFQTGLQSARRAAPGGAGERRALAAALESADAKAIAEHRLEMLWAARETATLNLSWRHASLRAGAAVRIEGRTGVWRIVRIGYEDMVVALELVRMPAQPVAVAAASPGRPVAEPDLRHGRTTLFLFDLPLGSALLPTNPQLVAVSAGEEPGWRGAALLASFDGGASWEPAGRTAAPAVMGHVVQAAGPAGSALFDAAGNVEVELLNDRMWIESRDDPALANGANLAVMGGELFQFGVAEPLGGRRFRLSRLLRARYGTEWAAADHAGGEPFALIEQDSVAALDVPAQARGGAVSVLASGLEDPADAQPISRAVSGEALRPPSPVHLRAEILATGDIAIGWVRRSRGGWNWPNGSDTPLGEEREAYRVTLTASGFTRTLETTVPSYLYATVEQAADGLAGPLTISVSQIGTSAPSRAAVLTTP